MASLAYLHKDAGPPEERGCFVVGPPDHALLGGFANVSVAPAGTVALHVPLHYVEAALLSVIGPAGGPEGQPLGAKRLTIGKIIDMSDFILDLGFHYSGTAEDTLHRLNVKTFTPDLLNDPRLALPPEAFEDVPEPVVGDSDGQAPSKLQPESESHSVDQACCWR